MAVEEPYVSVEIPNEILPLLDGLAHGKTVGENVRISLAVGLFASKTVSIGKAAEIAGLSLNDFIYTLKLNGIPWGEYTEEDALLDESVLKELEEKKDKSND